MYQKRLKPLMKEEIEIITLGSLTKLMGCYIEKNTEISIKNLNPR